MAVSFELNELSDAEVREKAEDAIRSCVEIRPPDETWQVWIRSSGTFCHVRLKGPQQTRERFFFESVHDLPELIRSWIAAYPLR